MNLTYEEHLANTAGAGTAKAVTIRSCVLEGGIWNSTGSSTDTNAAPGAAIQCLLDGSPRADYVTTVSGRTVLGDGESDVNRAILQPGAQAGCDFLKYGCFTKHVSNGRIDDSGQRGAKNVVVEMKRSRVEGVISSASFSYREGLTEITAANRTELSNITQKAAPTVNNGVIVRMDKDSTWYVTGTSYLTSLELAETSLIRGKGEKRVVMTVDGAETPLVQGRRYTGRIVLSLAD